MSPVEIAAVIVSAAGLWLLARRSLWSWPVSLVGVALYGWVFLAARLYSDMLLQGVFGVSCIYGWVRWQRRLGDDGAVTVARPSARETVLGALAGAVGAVALGHAMARYTDAAAPHVDATLTCFSLVAQLWTARRFTQSWWLWIALDVVYVGLYAYKGLYPTAGLYAVNIALCVYGLIGWQRAARHPGAPPTTVEANPGAAGAQ